MDNFNHYLQTLGEFGITTQVHFPLIVAEGLPLVKLNEIVIFETGQLGEVFAINHNSVEILIFSQVPVKVGVRIVRTNKLLTIPITKAMVGHTINPLGQPLSSSNTPFPPEAERDIDPKPVGIEKRSRIKSPLKTGVTIVDMMVPVGKGQKELIVGDRKTGKSFFLLSTIKNQIANEKAVAIYAMIAKKKSEIKKLEEFLKKEGLLNNVIIVATSANDSPSLIYLTPYTAMTIAEYFRDLGQDTVVVLDDLSTHAKFYREISLLAKRFPGRDSYPGDIFYTHARLLERTGNFKHPTKGEVSITCFPIVEIIEGDFTGYISTNLMGMTDGHIYFDSNIYYKGRRPAVNIGLSVTRVGNQIQTPVKKSINRELTAFLALFQKMQNFSHFGAELTESVKHILETGEKIYDFFDQPYSLIIPEQVQITIFALLWLKFIEEDKGDSVKDFRLNLTYAFYENRKVVEYLDNILKVETFNQLLGNVAKNKDQLVNLCRKKLPVQPRN